jgi:hypothetical protein
MEASGEIGRLLVGMSADIELYIDMRVFMFVDIELLSGDSLNRDRCWVTHKMYTHATKEQRGYAIRF